jgi:dCTP deaminase
MILSDADIKEYIAKEMIKIDPIPNFEEQLGPCSLDLHLGNSFKVFKTNRNICLDSKSTTNFDDLMEEIIVSDNTPFIVHPKEFIIAVTKEKITIPVNIMGRLDGRSSLARLGLVVHSTAGRFDPGWDGKAVMEFGNLGVMPIVVYPGMRIAAMTFETLSRESEKPYLKQKDHKYAGQNIATSSKLNEETK